MVVGQTMPLVPMIDVCALLVVAAMQVAASALLTRAVAWSSRRELQVCILALPALAVAFGMLPLLAARHVAGCNAWGAWDWTCTLGGHQPLLLGELDAVLLVLPAVLMAAALLLGIVRLALVWRVVARRSTSAPGDLVERVAALAARLRTRPPRVRLCALDRPLALTCGVWRPTLVLSHWMVEHLDGRELEAVLAHELAHAARQDFAVLWVASVLRDAFFYLPASRAAYRVLWNEKELACDDLAIAATQRPLGLASALAKVWHEATAVPGDAADHAAIGVAPAQSLVDTHAAHEAVEERLHRLLETRPAAAAGPETPVHQSPRMAPARLLGLLALASAGLLLGLTLMGCAPALLGR